MTLAKPAVGPFPFRDHRTVAEVWQHTVLSCVSCGAPITRWSKLEMCRICARAATPRVTSRAKLPPPADFYTLASTMTDKALQGHYKRSEDTVSRWRSETGAPRNLVPINRAEMPQDFALTAATMTHKELRASYGRSVPVINRWLAEAAVEARKPFTAPRRCLEGAGKARARPIATHRDMSGAGLAANFLQKFDAIWRCTESGKPSPSGTHWRYLGCVRTDAEIIERAERKGFDPDAWKRIAA